MSYGLMKVLKKLISMAAAEPRNDRAAGGACAPHEYWEHLERIESLYAPRRS